MTNYVDCGRCPEGECLKSKVPELPAPPESNLFIRSPYDPVNHYLATLQKTELVCWVYYALKCNSETIPKETPIKEAINDPDILKCLDLPDSVQTVGDFIDYVDNPPEKVRNLPSNFLKGTA